MGSIEVIKVRSFSEIEKQKVLEIFLNMSIEDQKELFNISLLQEKNMTMDFVVCIYWKETRRKKYSDISDRLNAALKNYGWISRSVWEPVPGMAILDTGRNEWRN